MDTDSNESVLATSDFRDRLGAISNLLKNNASTLHKSLSGDGQ